MPPICGIIAEYNPFHNGHLYHIKQAMAASCAEALIVALSGNFVQRGEAAIIDKFSRTAAALHGGADMVIELPLPHATATAEAFALGGCRLLAATNIVDVLCFGSESDEIAPLYAVAYRLCHESGDFKAALRQNMARGLSFPAARAAALNAADAKIISTPNNILSVEYLKAIIKENLPLQPIAVKRSGADHNASVLSAGISSASAIRKHMTEGGSLEALKSLMPPESFRLLCQEHIQNAINHIDNFSHFFHYALQNLPKSELSTAAASNFLISHIIHAAKTKNRTHAALRRAALEIILKTPANLRYAPPPYIRVLGFKRSRRDLLQRLHKSAALPVITNLKHAQSLPPAAKTFLGLEFAATKTYWLALKPYGVAERSEFSQPMVIL